VTVRNDLTIYETHAADWWTGQKRFMRALQALVPPRLRFFDEAVPDWRGRRVIDVGCGGGFMSVALAHRGARVLGIDPSKGSLAAARAQAERAGVPLELAEGVGESLPAPSGEADAVVCVDVLEHVKDLKQVVSELARVLRPGGVLLFDTINRNWLARAVVIHLAEDVLRITPKGTHDPKLFIKPSELSALLEVAGFEQLTLAGLGPLALNLKGDPVFTRLPFRSVMYMGHCVRA
jgi:2-polyprenyl-6-hydroxyphenyl methylase/3-demethylubiquinone-9 3-methyltransferase